MRRTKNQKKATPRGKLDATKALKELKKLSLDQLDDVTGGGYPDVCSACE
jgi:hypothetical protein